MIFEYFDAAYYINLDSRPERRENFERRTKEIGFVAERFSAISLDASTSKEGNTDPRDHQKRSCTLSHFGVVELAKERQHNCVLIFEDDCVFLPEFQSKVACVVQDMKQIDDWDVLYLGGSPEPDFCAAGSVCERISPNLVFNPGAVWGTHAYAMNSRFYEKFLNSNKGIYPTDMNFIVFPRSHRRYIMVDELITTQDETPSDLWGGTISRTKIYQDNYNKYMPK